MYTVLLVIHTIVVLFLIIMVLVQRTDSDGMGGLGGGGGGGNQFLTGRSAANLMTRTTAILATVFMISSLLLAVIVSRMTAHSIVDAAPAQEQAAPLADAEKAGDTVQQDKKMPVPVVPKPE